MAIRWSWASPRIALIPALAVTGVAFFGAGGITAWLVGVTLVGLMNFGNALLSHLESWLILVLAFIFLLIGQISFGFQKRSDDIKTLHLILEKTLQPRAREPMGEIR